MRRLTFGMVSHTNEAQTAYCLDIVMQHCREIFEIHRSLNLPLSYCASVRSVNKCHWNTLSLSLSASPCRCACQTSSVTTQTSLCLSRALSLSYLAL
jgi:hypothetical protein